MRPGEEGVGGVGDCPYACVCTQRRKGGVEGERPDCLVPSLLLPLP